LADFDRIGRDLPGAFAARARDLGVQILTGAASHAYLPLLVDDRSVRAQLRAGTEISRKHIGSFQGMWLPECAYRPSSGHWQPAVLGGESRPRAGLEEWIAGAGIDHFFVESTSVQHGKPVGTINRGKFEPVSEVQLYWDHRRGWHDVLEPVGVASEPAAPLGLMHGAAHHATHGATGGPTHEATGGPTLDATRGTPRGLRQVYAMARHPRVSEQVWSSVIGYPGEAAYLEFHRKHGDRGLRYWKVTDHSGNMDAKQPYAPQDAARKAKEHAAHFCTVVREVLLEYHDRTGRRGTVTAPFDAELFGHWWHEGPLFLKEVLLALSRQGTGVGEARIGETGLGGIDLRTARQTLDRVEVDKVVRLPEGSWGENGNHGVWLNDKTRWMWEVEYRAEIGLAKHLRDLPWRKNADVAAMLKRAGRELLLLQASDWPFLVHGGAATDYAFQRFGGHATRFERALGLATHLSAGGAMSDLHRAQIAEMDLHDVVFDAVDLAWWE
jgi:1,4-alpha-glucan branching enzyme